MHETARCRSCGAQDLDVFLSLGKLPLPDALLTEEELGEPEARYPLDVAFCPGCTLVQILHEVPPEVLFVDNYLYFSSFSDTLLQHSRRHALGLIESRSLGGQDLVFEIASNDGYLLRNFVEHGVPVLGMDPAPDQAAAARGVGVPTLEMFFDTATARELVDADLRASVIIANNVMAHVPDLNSFVRGMRMFVADDGVITVENPYVRMLIDNLEFDTIYHEHFSYFSCTAVDRLARRHGLWLNRVESFPDLHGGTLRWWLGPRKERHPTVDAYLAAEEDSGLTSADYYRGFAARVETTRRRLRRLLEDLRSDGARIAAYGAAAKGTVLLNHVGIGPELVDYVVDRNVHKQGRYMPGVHLPIRDPSYLLEDQPDVVLLLAWNFADEIMEQQAEYRRRGGRFIVPIPELEVVA